MTLSDALFDVPAPTSPAEGPAPLHPVARLLDLAGEYTRHNDALDVLDDLSAPDPGAYARSAHHLAEQTTAAINAVAELRLFGHANLTAALTRLTQVAYLADAAGHHDLPTSRKFTAFAPEAVVDSAALIAAHQRRRRSGHAPEPDDRLDAVQQAALHEIALGHVVRTSSQGRDYVHSTGARVPIGTLRSLEANGLTARVQESAPPAYVGGGRQDRIRLSPAGAAALATVIARTPAGSPPGPPPAPTPTKATTRRRS
ncbi:hypothetical protein [Streptomyces californicus]|uniref:hypothetical protein n=1 Tax=Streptomyces californicus TaxID=67351 RepID=UPI0033212874